jgi:hypothetical protein
MIVSLLLCFLAFAEVAPQHITVLGTELSNFGNPEAVILTLWIVWFYFLIRYTQYFTQEGYAIFAQTLATTLNEICAPRIKEIVLAKHPNNHLRDYGLSAIKNYNWTYNGQTEEEDDTGERKYENFKMKIDRSDLWKQYVLAILNVTFAKSAVSDHLVPFGIAMFAAIYSGAFYYS